MLTTEVEREKNPGDGSTKRQEIGPFGEEKYEYNNDEFALGELSLF
jgi:hypothetical protein